MFKFKFKKVWKHAKENKLKSLQMLTVVVNKDTQLHVHETILITTNYLNSFIVCEKCI